MVNTKPPGPDHFLAEAEYRQIFDALRDFSRILLFEIHERSTGNRDLIIRNFIARAAVTLESIMRLYDARAYGDCWSLFRMIVDRHFHLHVIATKDDFEAFEAWTFIRQFEMNNNVWSDKTLTSEQKSGVPKPTPEQKKRYKALKASGVTWREPKAEEAAKSFGVPILYKFGYDYASRFLHPSATDGVVEFEYLTQLGSKGDRGDQRVILHDSALAFTILIHEALNASGLEWRSLIFDCVESFRKALTDGPVEYAQCLLKVANAGPEFEWARAKPQVSRAAATQPRRGCRSVIRWLFPRK